MGRKRKGEVSLTTGITSICKRATEVKAFVTPSVPDPDPLEIMPKSVKVTAGIDTTGMISPSRSVESS